MKLLRKRSRVSPSDKSGEVHWSVERLSTFRFHLYVDGWAFIPGQEITALSIDLGGEIRERIPGWGLPSPDIENAFGSKAATCRFSIRVPFTGIVDPNQVRLRLHTAGGDVIVIERLNRNLDGDPFLSLYLQFQEMVQAMPTPHVVEVGSRARSGNIYTEWLPTDAKYTGFDIVSGPNVNVVGDAHQLSEYFPRESVDAIFAVSTLEHLIMPWKVALEMNEVLTPGGVVFMSTHQTWAVHDAPWDYWRFSNNTWDALFNRDTGFEVLNSAMGEKANIVAELITPATSGLDLQPAFLGSGVIAKKVGSTELSWNVLLKGTPPYPA
jgi:hypothetical protein